MAISPEVVERLAQTLKTFGYPLAGHVAGQPDAAFMTSYQKALTDIQTMAGATANGTLNPAQFQDLEPKLNAVKADPQKLGALRAYASGQSFPSGMGFDISGDALKLAITSKGVPQGMVANPETAKTFLAMVENPSQILADMKTVETHRNPAVWGVTAAAPVTAAAGGAPSTPAPTPAATPAPTPAAPDPAAVAAEAARVAAAQRVLAEQQAALKTSVQNIQKRFFNEPTGDGVNSQAFKDKLTTYVKDIQTKAKAAGWTGPEDGQYTPAFRDFLNRSSDPMHASFAASMDPYVAAGGNAPATAAAPAPGGTPAPGAPAPTPGAPLPPLSGVDPTPQEAATKVEGFLGLVVSGINAKSAALKEKGGLFGMVLLKTNELPMPGTVDGVIDNDSRRSLQAVLKTFQPQLELTDEEIYNYSPAVGDKIRKNFPKIEKGLTDVQREQLKNAGGIDAIIRSLNVLQANNQLGKEQLYTGERAIQLSAMGVSILNWVFQIVGRIFPGAQDMMHGMLAQFTGGLGYNDLVPKDQQIAQISGSPGAQRASLPPQERLQQEYLAAFKSAQTQLGPNATPADVKTKLNDALRTGLKAMQILPFGTDELNKAYEAAYEKGFAAAMQEPTPEGAAAAFARTFTSAWDSTVQLDPGTGQPILNQSSQAKVDPTVTTFKADGHDMNSIMRVYERHAAVEDKYFSTKRPIVFQQEGKIYMAGMTGADNIFTVRELTPEALAALKTASQEPDQVAAKAKLYEATKADPKMAGLSTMLSGYGQYMNLGHMQQAVTEARTFSAFYTYLGTREGNLRGQERADENNNRVAADQARAREKLFGDPSQAPGVDRGGSVGGQTRRDRSAGTSRSTPGMMTPDEMVAVNRGISETNYQRYSAMQAPQLVKSEFERGGRREIMVLTYEDPNGFASKYTGNGRSMDSALTHGEYFGTRNINKDFWNFRRDFSSFVNEYKRDIGNWGVDQQLEQFAKMRGDRFAQDYPDMARVTQLPGYRGTVYQDNILRLYKSVSDTAAPYVGSGWQPQVTSYEASSGAPGSTPPRGSDRPLVERMRTHNDPSWNPLYRFFNNRAREKAGYTTEEPPPPRSSRDSDRDVRGQTSSEPAPLDPRRPVAAPPKPPGGADGCPPGSVDTCVANADGSFPEASRATNGGTPNAASTQTMFQENGESATVREPAGAVDPDNLFPGARAANPTSGAPGAR